MKLICRTLLLLTIFVNLSPVVAGDQFLKDIEVVREVYLKATNGDERDLRKAIGEIRKLEIKYQHHPLILAYKGGALSLRGRNIGKRPFDRMRETEEGLHIIDRALRELPAHKGHYLEIVETRLVAAFVFINLPDAAFHRLQKGSHLVEQLLAHSKFTKMPQGLQAAIYFSAAIVADKFNDQDQFKHYLELTIKTDPRGENGKEAQALLSNIAG